MMKKSLLCLVLSSFSFLTFTQAYNCSTIESRFESFDRKRDNHEYEAQVLEARSKRVSNQYEAAALLQDMEVRQTVTEELQDELNELKDEISWCDDQRDKVRTYLKTADSAFNEIKNATSYPDNAVEEAIKYYNKAYDLMKGDYYVGGGLEKDVKERIDFLEEYKKTYKTELKLLSIEKEAYDYAISGENEKALKLYKEVLSYKTTYKNHDYSSAEKNIELLEKNIEIQKNQQKSINENTNNSTTEMKDQNPTTQMRYITKDEELKIAVQWMYDNGLTIYSQVQDFLPNNEITREQASKFFVEFAAKVLGKDRGTINSYNIFSDLGKADPTLKDHIIYANNMGLFKGSNGKFNPFNKLTKAQAIAVTVRMANGYMDENFNPRYLNYYYTADSYGILKWGGFEYDTLDKQNISRGDMALILYNLYLYLNNK